jgi:hypothetical protein
MSGEPRSHEIIIRGIRRNAAVPDGHDIVLVLAQHSSFEEPSLPRFWLANGTSWIWLWGVPFLGVINMLEIRALHARFSPVADTLIYHLLY